MQATVVIPVWNGASVLPDCLDALYANSGPDLLEVICVDNASADGSAALIGARYPQARLIPQPVNLGFAGGVNAGIDVAAGDVMILLNQDCVVQPGWLVALVRALAEHPQFGIAGCTVLNADGSLNHTGAAIRRPDAYGVHLTATGEGQPVPVEYVTGAAFALRRQTWDIVGRFDEGYYPAYYEESDYCYRARRRGLETACVPEGRVVHLLTSREWQVDPVKHTANQHRARYRFVVKHFDSGELDRFFPAEYEAIGVERYFDQAVARVMAARDTLRGLSDILERRQADLGDAVTGAHRRQLQVGFTQVLRQSFSAAEKLSQIGLVEPPALHIEPFEAQQPAGYRLSDELSMALDAPSKLEALQTGDRQLQALQQREHDLLTRIYFRSPSAVDQPESLVKRLFRLLVLRLLSFITGREHLLLAELNAVHVARLDVLQHIQQIQTEQARWLKESEQLRHRYIEQYVEYLERYVGHTAQADQLRCDWIGRTADLRREQLARRLQLLEILTDYDYR